MVFLYYIILKLNYLFLPSTAFSSENPEVISASFLFHRFETWSLNGSWDHLSRKLEILESPLLKIKMKSGQLAKLRVASNSEQNVAYKISHWRRRMNWKKHKL